MDEVGRAGTSWYGCKSISAILGKVIMKSFLETGRCDWPLIGFTVKIFAYHAEELGLLSYWEERALERFKYPGSRQIRFAFKKFANNVENKKY